MRDIDKNIKKGHEIIRKHERADLMTGEMHHFYENFQKVTEEEGSANGLFNLISDVFYFGVAVGARNKGNVPQKSAERRNERNSRRS